jgi:hypothetical protein
MRLRLQFAGCLVALGISAMILVPCYAQRGRANWAQNRPADKPPKPPKPPARQQQKQEHRQQQQEARRAQVEKRQNEGANRSSATNPNRTDPNARPNSNPNRPPSAYTPPPAKKFNSLPQQEQQRILQSNRNFEKLTPAQKQQQEEAAKNWSKLTPVQQGHIRNEVIPKWKQMPKDRQDAIQHRLAVLRNMPESARNQHLNDPNFTRGMSDEDKAMLHDLSHMHVGGAPEPPSE